MRLRNHLIVVFGIVTACAGGTALADAPATTTHAAPADGDVTMTVIPSGVDVVKTVVQNITVPAKSDEVAKAKGAHKATQDSQSAQETAQQLAEAAAEHQAGQTQQQVEQQALQAQIAANKAKNPPSPPKPPPPPRPPERH